MSVGEVGADMVSKGFWTSLRVPGVLLLSLPDMLKSSVIARQIRGLVLSHQ